MIQYADPPSGWMYGFPKPFNPEVDNLPAMLRAAKYPEKDITFALENMRIFYDD